MELDIVVPEVDEQAAAVENTGAVMVNYDVDEGVDDKDAQSKTSSLKLDFDRTDVVFWFQQLEMHLQTAGIKAQWTKRLLLHKQLPPDVIAELKDLLRKDKSRAGAQPYKDLKDRIIETFGQKPEDAFEEAEALMLVGKPSQLCNRLVNILCPEHPDLANCCAARMVSGLWRKKLPQEVRQQVAGMSLVGKDNMKATLNKADSVYATLKRGAAVAAVDFDTSADEPALQVAAFKGKAANKKFQPRKAVAGGQAKDRGKPHEEGTPSTVCNTHWKYGRSAFTCRKKDTCPWAHLSDKNSAK